MSNHSTQFEATDGGMALTNAILLYKSGGSSTSRRDTAFASIHPVEEREGKPLIGVGAPLSRAHLRQWTEALGRSVAPEILPENVLVSHPDVLAWWVPEQVRPGYFNLANKPAGLKALVERTTAPVPYPAHLFVATRSDLGVYALPASQRPTAETMVLHSPVLNVYTTGKLCWGNIPKPKVLTIAAIPEFERAVFDSWSTHPNLGQDLTVTGKGGLVRLWDDLAARRAQRFPVKCLKPFGAGDRRSAAVVPMTLARLIAGSGRA